MVVRRVLGGILGGLALLAQLLLPVAASRFYAQATDPFGHIVICATDSGPRADQSAPGGVPAHHHHCPLCQIAVAVSPVLPAKFISVAELYPETRPVFWTAGAAGRHVFGFDRHSPPRGPPSLI